MRFSAVALLLFFSICIAASMLHAAENGTDMLPPIPPSQEGPLPARAIYSNGSAAQNCALVLLARSGKSDTVYRLITDANGRFLLSLGKEAHEIDALIDNPNTPGMDFASTASVPADGDSNLTLIFYPAGSLSGKALQSGSPVPKARVRVSCPSNSFDYGRINGVTEVASGEAGEFMFRALPVGTCTVSASTDSMANSADVQVLQGQTSEVPIELMPKAPEPSQLPPITTAVIALALAVLAAYYLLRNRIFRQKKGTESQPAEKKEEPVPKAAKAPKPIHESQGQESSFSLSNPQVRAVLSTLSDREQGIVKFLFKCGGRAKRSTIQHKLLIPKTSLLRNLRSLERKKIVRLTPFGRNLIAEVEEKLFS